MTKFKLMSDLHLEFFDRKRYGIADQPVWMPPELPDDKDTVLLLAGDIHVGTQAKPWIEIMCARFKHVIYILGNHEFYHNEFYEVKDTWQYLKMPDNFTFLDDGIQIIDDVRIIGGTLWTDVRDQTKDFGFTVWNGKQRMSDYRVTTINHKRTGQHRMLTPEDTIAAHKDTLDYFKIMLAEPFEGKTIVMTHHLPHEDCVADHFKDNAFNPFYVTNLDYVMDNFNIDVWVHGHTHSNIDIKVHDTRILCNPRGYHGVELNRDFNEDLTFEL